MLSRKILLSIVCCIGLGLVSAPVANAEEPTRPGIIADPTAKPKPSTQPSHKPKPKPNTNSNSNSNSGSGGYSGPSYRVSTGTNSTVVDLDKVYEAPNEVAEFPGGEDARNRWQNANIEKPVDATGRKIHGAVHVNFVVERDGSLSNIEILSSTNPNLNRPILDMIKRMPNWIPAKFKGYDVRSLVDITFMI